MLWMYGQVSARELEGSTSAGWNSDAISVKMYLRASGDDQVNLEVGGRTGDVVRTGIASGICTFGRW